MNSVFPDAGPVLPCNPKIGGCVSRTIFLYFPAIHTAGDYERKRRIDPNASAFLYAPREMFGGA